MDTDTHALETKAGIPLDAAVTHAEMMRAFEAFKETNDARLALDAKRAGDVVLDEKLARIDSALDAQARRLDDIVLKGARPALGSDRAPARNAAATEHKAAFDAYVRAGEAAGLRALEAKAMTVGSNPDGGYLVPPEVETADRQAAGRDLADPRHRRPAHHQRQCLQEAVHDLRPRDRLGRRDAMRGRRPTSPTLDELSFPAMELYAMPAATATLLEDAAVNIDEWLAQEVDAVFAAQEGTAFVNGDGVNKPKGFLTYTTVANASWSWGNIGFIASGAAGAFPASHPSDTLVDLIYALKAGYRQNASFVMNRKTQSVIRKFKDSQGGYLWQPPAVAGGKASLMTFPVVEAEDMPDIGANALSIAFGDFGRGYLVVDRAGVSVLRDPYTAKPYVLFYTTKRVGGGVQDYDAIKLMKFAAS